jgi:hypothetical protein
VNSGISTPALSSEPDKSSLLCEESTVQTGRPAISGIRRTSEFSNEPDTRTTPAVEHDAENGFIRIQKRRKTRANLFGINLIAFK